MIRRLNPQGTRTARLSRWIQRSRDRAAAVANRIRVWRQAVNDPSLRRQRAVLALGLGFIASSPLVHDQDGAALARSWLTVGGALAGGAIGSMRLSRARASLTRLQAWIYGTPVVLASAAAPVAVVVYATAPGHPVIVIANASVSTLGSWTALHWADHLARLGLTAAEFARATTTVRGLGAGWLLFFATFPPLMLLNALGHKPDLRGMVEALWGLLGVASAVLYAGPAYSEYVEGRAIAQARAEAAAPPLSDPAGLS